MDTRNRLYGAAAILAGALLMPAAARADGDRHQICTLASGGVGQSAAVVCKDVRTGMTVQSVPAGASSAGPGGVGGALARRGDKVLVTGLIGGAMLLTVSDEHRLQDPVRLMSGADTLSGALTKDGAYVLTGAQLQFFPGGNSAPRSQGRLLQADGSAAQVVVTGGYAYVSEKTGSLEAFPLGPYGDIGGPAAPVAGIPAGAIVGTAALRGSVVAPVAHLAVTDGSVVPVVRGVNAKTVLPTRELAACWTAADADEGEVCITNPGTMTVSCGQFDSGFTSFTSIANTAPLAGDALFDIDMRDGLVGVNGTAGGSPAAFVFEREGDFVRLIGRFPMGAGIANGALLL